MRLVLYTGKGGVGKTTTAAATAAWASQCGERTLLLSADPAHSLGDVLEIPLGPEPRAVAPGCFAAEIAPLHELETHWGEIRRYLAEVYRSRGVDELLAEELAILPGIEELAILLAVERWADDPRFGFVVVDCAPTASALRLTTLPEVLSRSLRLLPGLLRMLAAAFGPLMARASAPLPGAGVFGELEQLVGRRTAELRQRLTGPRTSFRIVTTPERASLAEARRLRAELALFGVPCDALVVNRVLPPELLAQLARLEPGSQASERQARALADAARDLAPLALLQAPHTAAEPMGFEALAAHGRGLFGARPPHARLAAVPAPCVRETAEGCELRLPLPGARPEALEVTLVDDDLWVGIGGRRRAVPLPAALAELPLLGARLEGDELVVRFGGARALGPLELGAP